MANLLQKAQAGEVLSAGQRSLLKLLQGSVVTFLATILVTAGTAVYQYAANNPEVDWTALLVYVGGALTTTIGLALNKLRTALNEPTSQGWTAQVGDWNTPKD